MAKKFEDEVLLWAPSLRALVRSNSYEEYLTLMREYEAELADKVDAAFD